MAKTSSFRNLVTHALHTYGFSAEGFAKFSDIPARSLQHLLHGDHRRFSLENERKFYRALEKLDNTSASDGGTSSVIDFTKSNLPVCMKIGNLVITFGEIEEAYND